jgi:hypothetical protein
MPHATRLPAARTRSWTALLLGVVTCTSVWASPVLIIRSNDLAGDAATVQAVANLSALHIAAGNTVTVSVDLPASLAGYSQVWDLGFRLGLDAADRAGYVSYLQQGGRLAVFGENEVVFGGRNGDIRQLIADAGGGTVGGLGINSNSTQTVRAPFDPTGTVASVELLVPGGFDGEGNGSWALALADDSLGSGLYFDPGDLVNAPAGKLLSVLEPPHALTSGTAPAPSSRSGCGEPRPARRQSGWCAHWRTCVPAACLR